jgi:hypothetical protein
MDFFVFAAQMRAAVASLSCMKAPAFGVPNSYGPEVIKCWIISYLATRGVARAMGFASDSTQVHSDRVAWGGARRSGGALLSRRDHLRSLWNKDDRYTTTITLDAYDGHRSRAARRPLSYICSDFILPKCASGASLIR